MAAKVVSGRQVNIGTRKKVATTNTNAPKVTKRPSASELVALRNRFFYVSYRKLTLIFVAASVLCIFSLVSAFYFAGRKTPPIYVNVGPSGQLVPTYPLNQPTNPDPEAMDALINQLCLEGARRAYTYDYLNYTEQVNTAQPYFTYRGWENFSRTLMQSQNLNTVQQQKMIVKFTPKDNPVTTATDVRGGRLVWAKKFNATIQYVAHDGQHQGFARNVVVKMVVVRMSSVDSPKGLGIDQIVVEEEQTK